MDLKRYHCNYFLIFFDESGLNGSSYEKEKEDYNPLDYFCMKIIKEISFFFSLTLKTQPVVKNHI